MSVDETGDLGNAPVWREVAYGEWDRDGGMVMCSAEGKWYQRNKSAPDVQYDSEGLMVYIRYSEEQIARMEADES